MSEPVEPRSQLIAPHTPVDANRGIKFPDADLRDARKGKPE